MPVRFYREYVIVEAAAGRTRVVGDYHFRNTANESVSLGIHYPFPVDRHRLYPMRINAEEKRGESWRPIGFTRSSDGIDWRMRFSPLEEKLVRVEYVQEALRSEAVYIVKTTSRWGRALELAEFEFRVPASFRNVKLSFEPDRTETRGDTVFYYMSRTDFLPDEDLSLDWD